MSGPAQSTERAYADGIAERERVVLGFFERERSRLAAACHAMARSFARGGTLISFGAGPAATDAAHAAVEFMHPVIVGKRALPALAPSNDPTGLSTLAHLAGPDDIALALSHERDDPMAASFLAAARDRGLLTIALGAGPEPEGAPVVGSPLLADFAFAVSSGNPEVVQEVHETAYHVLWELVHVFFDHPGLVDEACITCGDVGVRARVAEVQGPTAVVEVDGAFEQVATDLVEGVQRGDVLLCHAGVALERVEGDSVEPAGFLYPFLDREEGDLEAVLADVEASTAAKAAEVTELRAGIDTAAVARCAAELRECLAAGGRLLTFGNGGSATDAQDLAADALARGWRALALNNDGATVTAVANDVGFDRVFARQLIGLGRHGDVAVAISTSGGSPNLIAAVEEAHRRGMLTVALTGHDGGRLAALDGLDHLFIVPSDHVPRIQEAQATIYHLLMEGIGRP